MTRSTRTDKPNRPLDASSSFLSSTNSTLSPHPQARQQDVKGKGRALPASQRRERGTTIPVPVTVPEEGKGARSAKSDPRDGPSRVVENRRFDHVAASGRRVWVGDNGRLDVRGGKSGSYVQMTMHGDGISSAVYTVPVYMGDNRDEYELQIDTGSADSWIMAKGCSSSACAGASGPAYNTHSSSATDTDQHLDINYLRGAVSGDIYWDTFELGEYSIGSQAFVAAADVQNEDLSVGYSGLVGLALQPLSAISDLIPPTTSDNPDGAPVMNNIFGLPGDEDGSSKEHFMGILLERPGGVGGNVPSLLTIGVHPGDEWENDDVDWDNDVVYSGVVPYPRGSLYWALGLTGITVYVDGQAHEVTLGRSKANLNSLDPVAVLDTGVPFMFARQEIADAVYAPYGVSADSNGIYYVPCTTPINMTISLGPNGTYAVHPLDASFVSRDAPSSSLCAGSLQASNIDIADVVLGAAFLRNVYTVLSYDRIGSAYAAAASSISNSKPAVGLLSLTNIGSALAEFNAARSSSSSSGGDSGSGGTSGGGSGGGGTTGGGGGGNGNGGTSNGRDSSAKNSSQALSGLGTGGVVGIVLGGVALLVGGVLLWWFLLRRKRAKGKGSQGRYVYDVPLEKDDMFAMGGMRRKTGASVSGSGQLDGETLAWKRASSYGTGTTLSASASTRVGPDESAVDEWGHIEGPVGAVGVATAAAGPGASQHRHVRSMSGPYPPISAARGDDAGMMNIPMLDEITPASLARSTSRFGGSLSSNVPRVSDAVSSHRRHDSSPPPPLPHRRQDSFSQSQPPIPFPGPTSPGHRRHYSSTGSSASSAHEQSVLLSSTPAAPTPGRPIMERGLSTPVGRPSGLAERRGKSPLRGVTLPPSSSSVNLMDSPPFAVRDPLLSGRISEDEAERIGRIRVVRDG